MSTTQVKAVNRDSFCKTGWIDLSIYTI